MAPLHKTHPPPGEKSSWEHLLHPCYHTSNTQCRDHGRSQSDKILVHTVLGAPTLILAHTNPGEHLRMKNLVQSQQQLRKMLTFVFISVPSERHPQAEQAVSPQPAVHTEQPSQLCCTGHPCAGLLLKTHFLFLGEAARGLMGSEQPNPRVQGENGSFEGNL